MSDDVGKRALERIRWACAALPDVQERMSHGVPAWFVGGKRQLASLVDHHHDDRLALWMAATPHAQVALIASDPERFFSPPYVGCRGWVGMYLDVEVDWADVAGLLEEAYRLVAPPKWQKMLAARSGLEPETS